MIADQTSLTKRNSVKNNYNLIAEQYSKDFGNYIEDLDIYEIFEKNLINNAKILDIGAGTGRTYAYLHQKGYYYTALDFSKEMKKWAYKIHGEFPYILDDMLNIKKHFTNNSIDAVFAVYSLFHIPNEDLTKLFSDIYDILTDKGIFLFSFQLGQGEEMSNEPYLNEKGKSTLYMNYKSKEEIKNITDKLSFKVIYSKEKIENSPTAINSNSKTTIFMLVQK